MQSHPILFGKYILLDRISVGGMAEVFRAKSFGPEGMHRILAIKRILPAMADDRDFIEMFIDEAKIVTQLSHENICQIYDLGYIDNSYCISMEYVWGKDALQIQNRFRRLRQRMPLQIAAFIAAKVCEGLDYAHRKKDVNGNSLGIVHRDVSPQNILVSYGGEVKIIDFGIAKAVSRSSSTQTGVLKGKFGYMSPEQVRGDPLDQRSDIFAIGTVLFELCIGDRLFAAETDFATLELVRKAEIPMPSSINPMIPKDLESIILKALSLNSQKRYQWACDMQKDLMDFLVSQPPVFTASDLSFSLKKLFETEIKSELETLQEYERLNVEDLGPALISDDKKPRAVSFLGVGLDNSSFEMDEDPTEMKVVSNFSTVDSPTEVKVSPFANSIGASSANKSGDDGMTRIFTGEQRPIPSEPTFLFEGEKDRKISTHESRTLILSESDCSDRTQRNQNLQQPPIGSSTKFGSLSITKDIFLGVIVAALLIAAGLGVSSLWKIYKGSDENKKATIIVATRPSKTAQVMIDGKLAGSIKDGTPLTIKGIMPGDHSVAVIIQKKEILSRTVHLKPGELLLLDLALPVVDDNLDN